MEVFWNSVKKYRVLWIFALVMLVMALISLGESGNRQYFVYRDALDEVVATVQGEEITLLEFAVYVAHQETEVHKQAVIYNPNNTKEYWGLHTNGQFVRVATRDAAVQMAIHDELFYQLSQEFKITFSEEELQILQNDVDDFWYDLTDKGNDEKLGISKQDVYDALYKIAVAEKCQYIYANKDGRDYGDYNFASEDYLEFLRNYEYSVEEKVLNRIHFGYVTLEN
jgi:hypothetical protein